MSPSETISPTAHYTGYVWARNGLSHPRLQTLEGRVMFESLRPMNAVSTTLGGPSLESYLLARHRAIDALLDQAIEHHGVTQVIEVAAGLSPRGWRFTQRYGDRLTYIEADLPGMTARKRRALTQMGSLNDRHRVTEVDALRDKGPTSISGVAADLDTESGLAIITEGLLGYLDTDSVDGIWRRFARTLSGFASGRYISDLHLGSVQNAQIRAFRAALSLFVRGQVHLHFDNAQQAEGALRDAGFAQAKLYRASDVPGTEPVRDRGGRLAHILEASTR
jgi:O-methyltransferase involved in polyketide biosynthesis